MAELIKDYNRADRADSSLRTAPDSYSNVSCGTTVAGLVHECLRLGRDILEVVCHLHSDYERAETSEF